MKILFLTHPYPNYVPDLLLHGLRKLLGPDVIDFPKKECLYQGVLGIGVCPEDQKCPNWFPDDNGDIDREEINAKVNAGCFNFIVCDVRAVTFLKSQFQRLPPNLVLIDGEDIPVKIKHGPYIICRRETDGSDFSIPLPMAMPEEVFKWITSYDNSRKKFSIGFLGSTNDGKRKELVETISRHYPNTLFKATSIPTDSDPAPGGRLSRSAYYESLQKCRIVLSLSGAGHDTFRFWENGAINAVHVSFRFPLFIPNDFIEQKHIFRFSSIDELRKVVDGIFEEKINSDEIIQDRRYHLVRYHLTQERAKYFLEKITKLM